MRIISFEGCVAAGKTSLTNHFSDKLKLGKVLEDYEKNPFLEESYRGVDVNLETEITFLLILYSQVRRATKLYGGNEFVLCDFSIESNLIHAELSLNKEQLELFSTAF
ncbi:MAG: deoxynucleoside kinase [Candidatus Methanofastidiosia archaeon]